MALPAAPMLFAKFRNSLIGAGDADRAARGARRTSTTRPSWPS